MKLAPEEVAKIAEWQPTREAFGRDHPETRIRVESIQRRMKSSVEFGCELLDDDGLSNYYVLFAYIEADVPSFSFEHSVDGLLIYLSACAPVGVVGRSRKCVDPGLRSYNPLGIADLIDPAQPEGELEIATVDAVRWGGYDVLLIVEAGEPLPPGVRPYEYCLGPNPWDRVFHALFAATD